MLHCVPLHRTFQWAQNSCWISFWLRFWILFGFPGTICLVFATVWNQNLSFCMVFAKFWHGHFAFCMVTWYLLHVGMITLHFVWYCLLHLAMFAFHFAPYLPHAGTSASHLHSNVHVGFWRIVSSFHLGSPLRVFTVSYRVSLGFHLGFHSNVLWGFIYVF